MPAVAQEEPVRYLHGAVQQRNGNREGSDEEDRLLIIFNFRKLRVSRRHIHDDLSYDANDLIDVRYMWACFSDIKHQVSPNSNPNRNPEEYETQMISCLSSLSVPESEHRSVVQKVFRVVEIADSARLPVVVGVWESTCRTGPYTRPVGGRRRRGAGPAASSAIEGLESLAQIDESIIREEPSCAVCLEDFRDVVDQQQPMAITKLPCLHHFHLHCIAQCLEISNLCPLCRYAMPTEEEEEEEEEEED